MITPEIERSLYLLADNDINTQLHWLHATPCELRQGVGQVVLSFVQLTENGYPDPDFSPVTQQLASNVREVFPEASIGIALGGGDQNYQGQSWRRALKNPEQVAQSLGKLSRQLGARAVVLDYEGPAELNEYLYFNETITGQLHERGLQTRIAVQAGRVDLPDEVLQRLTEHATLDVMAYDQFGPWSQTIGPVSETEWSVSTMEQFLTQGVRPERLALGVPFYGYTYRGIQPGDSFASADSGVTNKEIEVLEVTPDWEERLVGGSNYLVNEPGNLIVSRVTPSEITDRIQRVAALGITRVFGWQAGQLTTASLRAFVA